MPLEEKLKENAELAVDIMNKYFKGERAGGDMIKYASLAITQNLKQQATKGATDTLKFAVGRSVSENAAELRGYVKDNLPEYAGKKAVKA